MYKSKALKIWVLFYFVSSFEIYFKDKLFYLKIYVKFHENRLLLIVITRILIVIRNISPLSLVP